MTKDKEHSIDKAMEKDLQEFSDTMGEVFDDLYCEDCEKREDCMRCYKDWLIKKLYHSHTNFTKLKEGLIEACKEIEEEIEFINDEYCNNKEIKTEKGKHMDLKRDGLAQALELLNTKLKGVE